MEMKKLTCEMCNSTDVVKQDGFFVCQSCGTKYTVEEAKKMMVEGKVDVSGSTVKIDTSDELKKLYDLAHRAKADGNSENAQKYYEQIITMDPDSWEANFYTVYYQAMNCTIAGIELAANRVTNCQKSVLALLKKKCPEYVDSSLALNSLLKDIIIISQIMCKSASNHYSKISSHDNPQYGAEYLSRCDASIKILEYFGDNVEEVFGVDFCNTISVSAWKNAVAMSNTYLKRSTLGDNASEIETKIIKYEPGYVRTLMTAKERNAIAESYTKKANKIMNILTAVSVIAGIIGVIVIISLL